MITFNSAPLYFSGKGGNATAKEDKSKQKSPSRPQSFNSNTPAPQVTQRSVLVLDQQECIVTQDPKNYIRKNDFWEHPKELIDQQLKSQADSFRSCTLSQLQEIKKATEQVLHAQETGEVTPDRAVLYWNKGVLKEVNKAIESKSGLLGSVRSFLSNINNSVSWPQN